MILTAKHASETKVSQEIQRIKVKMESMNDKIKTINERVQRLDPGSGGVLKADLQKQIAKLEEVWEGEVGTLKHELWQTIQAHNHNADLMKHHKDAIDQLQGRMSEHTPSPELENIHGQLLQVDNIMKREQAKQTQIDQFMQRLSILQQQLSSGLGGWGSGMQFQLPPERPPAAPPMQGSASATPQATSKKAQRKQTKNSNKTAKSPAAPNLAPTLRAEAPEFVPTTAGWSSDS